MLYRLNFGNGQVSDTFTTKKAAQRARVEQVDYSARIRQSSYSLTIEFRDPDTGEWFALSSRASGDW